jgi:hypothetical protein
MTNSILKEIWDNLSARLQKNLPNYLFENEKRLVFWNMPWIIEIRGPLDTHITTWHLSENKPNYIAIRAHNVLYDWLAKEIQVPLADPNYAGRIEKIIRDPRSIK